jgi:hypothetical protein
VIHTPTTHAHVRTPDPGACVRPQVAGIRQFVLQNLVYAEDGSSGSKSRAAKPGLAWRCNLQALLAAMPEFNKFEQDGQSHWLLPARCAAAGCVG